MKSWLQQPTTSICLTRLKLAIKKMTFLATKEFMAELKILSYVHHTNLVQLIGYCTTNSLFLVYEYIENGTLHQRLRFANIDGMEPLTWSQRVQISLDAARGLEYFHEHTKPTYVHRDIKPANILIDNNFHAKVADFGLANLTEDQPGSDGPAGTRGGFAPEYVKNGEVSPKLDVYAFGVVLFGIISGKSAILPTETAASPQADESKTLVNLFEQVLKDPGGRAYLHKYVDPALNGDYPVDSMWKLVQLAGRCTSPTPDMRPTMRPVVVQLMVIASTQEWEVDSLRRS